MKFNDFLSMAVSDSVNAYSSGVREDSGAVKPCRHCGRDLREVYADRFMRKRSKFCGMGCFRKSTCRSAVVTDGDGTWVVTASGQRARISPEDAGIASASSLSVDSRGYLRGIRGRFHRLVMAPIPAGLMVDHINQDKLDNRRENLRIVSATINNRNNKGHKSTETSSSRIVGVSFNRKRSTWRAGISCRGCTVSLGSFQSIDAAAAARRQGEDELWGNER